MATLFTDGRFQPVDASGNPYPGGKLWTYVAGTSVELASYTTRDADVPNSNPVILDAAGRADVWLGTGAYRLVFTDADDVSVWEVDNYLGTGSSGAYSLRDFGGVGDGTTDDTAAFVAAFAAITTDGGGELLIPAGTFLIDTAAVVLPADLTMTGLGWGVSKIKVGGAFVGFSKSYATHTDLNRLNLWCRNIEFVGSATAKGAFYLNMADNCTFERCRFTEFTATGAVGSTGYGVYLNNCYWTHFTGCQFEDISQHGILLDEAAGVGCNATTITGRCQFIGNNQAAFICVRLNGQNIEVSQSDFSGTSNGLHGIELVNTEGVHIANNYIERWLGHAIKADAGAINRRVVIENNVLNAASVPALAFDNASVNDRVVVRHNRFPDMGAGQTCIDFGVTTNAIEYGNDPDASAITDTYTTSKNPDGSYQDTFTGTLTGVTGTVTGTFYYELNGATVTLYMPTLTGTSNATTCTVTGLPTLITPVRDQFVPVYWRDNTSTDGAGQLLISTTGVMTLYKVVGTAGGFTASNTKGLLGNTVTYSVL